jgi:hypothetical protein
MPRERVRIDKVYKFAELDERAKETARDWFRQFVFTESHDWEHVLDDAKECLKLAGFTVDNIYFSGFSSQGDGACFEGSWRASDTKPVKAMKQHAPKDKTLHAIAAEMRAIAKLRPNASMSVKQRGHYNHEGCTEFSVTSDGPEWEDDVARSNAEWDELRARDTAIGDRIEEASKDAMRWIYRRLEAEYEYQNSNEVVDENIEANEYEFTEEGNRT